jgi:ATP-dependent Lon protease
MALVEAVLGPLKYASAAEELSAAVATPGVVAGLVWTSAGGGVQCVECVAVTQGQGRREGSLGEHGLVACLVLCISGGGWGRACVCVLGG